VAGWSDKGIFKGSISCASASRLTTGFVLIEEREGFSGVDCIEEGEEPPDAFSEDDGLLRAESYKVKSDRFPGLDQLDEREGMETRGVPSDEDADGEDMVTIGEPRRNG
jgi:hypothetical protein